VINFGILYGMGVTALQGNLGTDRKTAQEFYNKYFEQYAGLANYLEKTKEEAARLGYTKTLFGRRRYFEGIKSKIPFIKAAAERMAVNAPIQGTQADIIKIAMRRIYDWAVEKGLDSKINLILQIHDELIYEVSDDIVERVRPEINKIMEDVLPEDKKLGVPILANSSVGENWNNLK
jgi:DNA polymerase I